MASSLALRRNARHALCAFVLLGACLSAATPAAAYSILHTFAGGASDGEIPYAALIWDGADTLYGTTYGGGSANLGTVFKMKTDGTSFALLHSFAGGASDGAHPYAALIWDGADTFYGTTFQGGSSDNGTVFKMKTDGTGFTLLHSFAGGASDGKNPFAALILDGTGNLYGTTEYGGSSNAGTVFTLKTDGTGFTLLYSFAGYPSDGSDPIGALILDGASNLYGTTWFGGSANQGTVFTLATDGTGYAILHTFVGGASDGRRAQAGLMLDGAGNLYGTTGNGGASDKGTVFTLKTDGTGFMLLHSFAGPPSDGQIPAAALIWDGAGNLYGTTRYGGAASSGTVFTLATDGTGYTLLHSFADDPSDGQLPRAALIGDGAGNLYGTTSWGGSLGCGGVGCGTVFMLP